MTRRREICVSMVAWPSSPAAAAAWPGVRPAAGASRRERRRQQPLAGARRGGGRRDHRRRRTAIACVSDVSDKPGAQAPVHAAVERFGGVDILVNNAGIYQFGAFADYPDDILR